MSDLSKKAQISVDLQREMFRRAKAEYGLSVSVLKGRTEASESTLRNWANGAHAIPAWALGELGLPDHLTSLVLDPWGKCVGTSDAEDGTLDELGLEAAGFTAEYVERRADGSLCHTDKEALAQRAERLGAVADRAAKLRSVK